MTDADKTRFRMQMAALGVAYRIEVELPLSESYWASLRDLTFENFCAGAEMATRVEKFFPSISDLRRHAPGYQSDQAIASGIIERLRAGGWMMGVGWTRGAPQLSPVEREAIKRAGGMSMLINADADGIGFLIKRLSEELPGARGEIELRSRQKVPQIEAPAPDAKVLKFEHGEPANDVRALLRDLANGTAAETWPEKKEKVKA